MSTCVRPLVTICLVVFLVASCRGLTTLSPAVKCAVLPNAEAVTFTCITNTGVLLWRRIEPRYQIVYTNFSSTFNITQLGVFTVQLTMISGNNLTSTATIKVSSLFSIRTTLSIYCDDNREGIDFETALVINGPPPAPTELSISLSTDLLLISWSTSPCAVQYVVTISSGKVYRSNITTSDTNTTVTLPTAVRPLFCVTVYGVDSIGRRGPDSFRCSAASFLSDHTLSIVIGSIVGILLCLLLISAFVYFEHRRVVLRRGTGLNARNQLLIKDEEIEMNKTATGYLRGVDVHGETVLEVVGDKPQKLEWPGYGFYIEVPEGALPPGVTATVGVKIILGGQFTFPENRRLISAIYAVTCSEVFLKEVAVNIQHCAAIKTEEQCSMCRFIIAKCTQEVLPYRFREREGVFNLHTQYGAVKLKRFSFLGETASDDTDLKCTALMYYREQIPSPLVVDFHFVVIKNLGPYLQRVMDDYQGWSKDSTSFTLCFSKSTSIQLDLRKQEIDPWRILPLVSPSQVISSDDVSKFKAGQRIPHCSYELQLLPGKAFQRLLHEVALIGVSSPNSFHIRYPQPEENRIHYSSTSTSPLASPRDENELSNTLDISHVRQVRQAVRNVNDWQSLGIELGLLYPTLESIRTDERNISECKLAMIAAWLRQQDDVSKNGTPSWSVLQAALREIGENKIADHIKNRSQFPYSP